jgi:hypothetical protein
MKYVLDTIAITDTKGYIKLLPQNIDPSLLTSYVHRRHPTTNAAHFQSSPYQLTFTKQYAVARVLTKYWRKPAVHPTFLWIIA